MIGASVRRKANGFMAGLIEAESVWIQQASLPMDGRADAWFANVVQANACS